MTKASSNPRRYSRGVENLDPNQPLNVYLGIRVEPAALEAAIGRIEYLAEKHPEAELDIAAIRRSNGRIFLTLEVGMGPARQALRGVSPQLQASYTLLWDLIKTLFYANPVLCSPPTAEERQSVDLMGQRPQFSRPTSASRLLAS